AGVGVGDVLPLRHDGDAAGVVVLDHGDGGLRVVVRGAHGGVGVDVVVVAHLLAAELLGAGEAGNVVIQDGQAGPPVRVLAVAQSAEAGRLRLLVAHVEHEGVGVAGERGRGVDVLGLGVPDLEQHPVADRLVVVGGAGESDGRELLAPGAGEAAGAHGPVGGGVVLRLDDHGDRGEVLRGAAHHGGAADG